MAKTWSKKWQRNGWRTSGGYRVKNKAVVSKLLQLSKKVNVKWVSIFNTPHTRVGFMAVGQVGGLDCILLVGGSGRNLRVLFAPERFLSLFSWPFPGIPVYFLVFSWVRLLIIYCRVLSLSLTASLLWNCDSLVSLAGCS